MRSTPDFRRLRPASAIATKAARGASRKRDTKPELLLRRACHRLGLRYRVDAGTLPGRPDVVFGPARVAVFVDGDFWHGRNLEARLAKLRLGHNAGYWVAKVEANVRRDRRNDEALREEGWVVLRFWETDLTAGAAAAAKVVRRTVRRRRPAPS